MQEIELPPVNPRIPDAWGFTKLAEKYIPADKTFKDILNETPEYIHMYMFKRQPVYLERAYNRLVNLTPESYEREMENVNDTLHEVRLRAILYLAAKIENGSITQEKDFGKIVAGIDKIKVQGFSEYYAEIYLRHGGKFYEFGLSNEVEFAASEMVKHDGALKSFKEDVVSKADGKEGNYTVRSIVYLASLYEDMKKAYNNWAGKTSKSKNNVIFPPSCGRTGR